MAIYNIIGKDVSLPSNKLVPNSSYDSGTDTLNFNNVFYNPSNPANWFGTVPNTLGTGLDILAPQGTIFTTKWVNAIDALNGDIVMFRCGNLINIMIRDFQNTTSSAGVIDNSGNELPPEYRPIKPVSFFAPVIDNGVNVMGYGTINTDGLITLNPIRAGSGELNYNFSGAGIIGIPTDIPVAAYYFSF